MFKGRYSNGYVDYPWVGRITDRQVASFVKKHTHWWDRLYYHFMCDCAQTAFAILTKSVEEPKRKNWKF